MARFVALLRGINVGGHRVKMDRLRALFEELGFDDVSTFIASGNVLFSADSDDATALAARIEGHLETELGYAVSTLLRSPAELRDVAESEHAAEGDAAEGGSTYVTFLKRSVDDELRARFTAAETDTDRFRFGPREVYWLIDGKLSESPLFGKGVERLLVSTEWTARNLTTVRRLVAKLGTI